VPHFTDRGARLGTPEYMSPEQIRGETLDARTDIFSFGLVLYEMATGEQAFTGDNHVLRDAILGSEPRPLHELSPEVPLKLETIINKCLQKRLENRFSTAGELLAALEGARIEVTRAKSSLSEPAPRVLEAAAPSESVVGRAMEVVAMVRRVKSEGLREYLQLEVFPAVLPADVRERPFKLQFEMDNEGKPIPADILFRLQSPGFVPALQTKKLRVPVRGDSEPCIFQVTPLSEGDLVLILELLNEKEQLLASRPLRTRALQKAGAQPPPFTYVAVPLELLPAFSPLSSALAPSALAGNEPTQPKEHRSPGGPITGAALDELLLGNDRSPGGSTTGAALNELLREALDERLRSPAPRKPSPTPQRTSDPSNDRTRIFRVRPSDANSRAPKQERVGLPPWTSQSEAPNDAVPRFEALGVEPKRVWNDRRLFVALLSLAVVASVGTLFYWSTKPKDSPAARLSAPPPKQSEPPRTIPLVATFTLSISSVRGDGGGLNEFSIPARAARARFKIPLSKNDYKKYRVTLKKPEGEQVFVRDAVPIESGKQLVIESPVGVLFDGDYILTVTGVDSNGKTKADVDDYSIRFTHVP